MRSRIQPVGIGETPVELSQQVLSVQIKAKPAFLVVGLAVVVAVHAEGQVSSADQAHSGLRDHDFARDAFA